MHARQRVAWNLRRVRRQLGTTQEQLAVDAATDTSVISEIEGGKYNPSIDLLDRLAVALAIDVAVLFIVPEAGQQLPEPLRRRAGRPSTTG